METIALRYDSLICKKPTSKSGLFSTVNYQQTYFLHVHVHVQYIYCCMIVQRSQHAVDKLRRLHQGVVTDEKHRQQRNPENSFWGEQRKGRRFHASSRSGIFCSIFYYFVYMLWTGLGLEAARPRLRWNYIPSKRSTSL